MKIATALAGALLVGASLGPMLAQPAQAQAYPNRPITFIIGFAPGGPSDVLSRIIGRRMEQELKQPMVIENRSGAGGSLAAQLVARAAPDGYTVMLGTNSALTINPNIQKNVGYDATKDFDYVSMIGTQPDVLYVHPSTPAKSFAELVAHAKANPGKLNFGSGGIGTPAHLSGELLKIKAGLDIAHIPFRGTGPSIQAVVANHIQMAFNPPAPLLPFIQSNQVRPLAVTTPTRSGALPDIPTIHESGYPGFDTKNWHGLVLPAGAPKEVIATLHRALHATLNDPATKKQLMELGVDLTPGSPEDFLKLIRDELPMWGEIIRTANVKLD
ncbi:MAG: tripartite tricarboxylate transporter substrate binding protein [Variibacter sp.]|nr:tripartite tricarboxylate transporter substrate binding protein [Variibacter sp.]